MHSSVTRERTKARGTGKCPDEGEDSQLGAQIGANA